MGDAGAPPKIDFTSPVAARGDGAEPKIELVAVGCAAFGDGAPDPKIEVLIVVFC